MSPDGQWLAVTRPGNGPDLEVMLIPAAGGAAKQIAVLPAGWTQAFPLSWAADGKSVFVARQGQGGQEIFRVPIDGKAPTSTGIRWSGGIGRISAHPDGRQIALSTRRLSGETWVLQNIPPQREK